MFRIYGSEMCPDCIGCRMNFDAYGIPYEFHDVCASLKDLKDFLVLRDTEPVFDRLKAIHDIGLPALVGDDGSVFTDWEGYLTALGRPVLRTAAGQACGADGRSC